jgi:hypothetical protein
MEVGTNIIHCTRSLASHKTAVCANGKHLNLHEQFTVAHIPSEKTLHLHQIDATDARIDALVYERYRLTEDEI